MLSTPPRIWRRISRLISSGPSTSLPSPWLDWRTIMAGLAEFERDLIRERVKSAGNTVSVPIGLQGQGIVMDTRVKTRAGDRSVFVA
jgi:hypothetical protein